MIIKLSIKSTAHRHFSILQVISWLVRIITQGKNAVFLYTSVHWLPGLSQVDRLRVNQCRNVPLKFCDEVNSPGTSNTDPVDLELMLGAHARTGMTLLPDGTCASEFFAPFLSGSAHARLFSYAAVCHKPQTQSRRYPPQISFVDFLNQTKGWESGCFLSKSRWFYRSDLSKHKTLKQCSFDVGPTS